MVFVCAGGNPALFDDRSRLRLAPAARAQGRHNRRHLRRALRARQGGPARSAPRHAALGTSARLPRGLPRCRGRAVAVRDRRQPHHLLGRHLRARHDGGADRARPRPPARGRGRGLVPAHAYPRRLRPAAHGSALPARRRRREAARACCAPWRPASRRRSRARRLRAQAGVSLRQLERLFHRHVGHGIHSHYRWLRLDRARQLLRETTLPVLDVALATGFASSSQFARAYARSLRRAAEPHPAQRVRSAWPRLAGSC